MVSFAKQGLLKNLDDYATAFGWDKWPVPQLNQNRVATDGTRGSGSLYAMGLNYSLTGIFYNKKLAAQIGMTEPPKTLAEFDDLLAKAKAAGLQPIMEWGSAKSGMGLAFPLQNLMAAYGPVEPINDWIFQKKGATIDTADNLKAAQHLEEWIKNGYFPPDINAIEYTDAAARFGKGEGVFTFNGDWQNAGYDKDLSGNVGFFLMPPADASGSPAAMSAPLTMVSQPMRRTRIALHSSSIGLLRMTRRGRSMWPLAALTPVGRWMPRCLPSQQAQSQMTRLLPGRWLAKPAHQWTLSPTQQALSSPRAGHLNSRRWLVASRMLPGF
jgi:maltose-binding protein MalE